MFNGLILYNTNALFLLTRKFAKRVTSSEDAVIILGIVLLLAILLVISKTISFKDKKNTESANWEHIKSICKEKNLTEKEISTLVNLLSNMKLKHPLHAMTSMDVFDNFIMSRLTKHLGSGDASYIRKKIFLTPLHAKSQEMIEVAEIMSQVEEEPAKQEDKSSTIITGTELPADDDIEDILDNIDIGGTSKIMPGEEIKLNFTDIPSMHSCGVILNDENGIVVFLPKYQGEKFLPHKNTTVEGYLVQDEDYFYFDSEIDEVFTGEVNSCRLKHASLLHQIKRRQFARADIDHPFKFYHIPAAELTNSGRLNKKTVKYLCDGILENISAGGCAVRMSIPDPMINPGDLLRFPISLPGEKDPVKVMGSVLKSNIDKEVSPDNLLLNLKFIGLDQGAKDELIAAVFKLLRSKDQS
ncbi:MAG: PilZ domain-containing protein [Planctomycetota bacterium]|jgi:c-di-GMP-binding flagellar brake protein YcgR